MKSQYRFTIPGLALAYESLSHFCVSYAPKAEPLQRKVDAHRKARAKGQKSLALVGRYSYHGSLKCRQEAAGLHVHMPAEKPSAVTLKMTFA